MPIEPAPSAWNLDVRFDPRSDLVAYGADLAPGTLLNAYRRGLFPMRARARDAKVAWWSPVVRGVLPVAGMRVSRSLRASTRRFEIRIDTAFEQVVACCAEPSRRGAWIDADIASAYGELHKLGWAHSVEAWSGGVLAGGLYGVAIGGLFAGESMFSRERDASKVALWALMGLLDDEYAGRRLVDAQWQTDHLASLGVVEIPRTAYLTRLADAVTVPPPAVFG
ncbi:MAG: leucyl/phenylalanyl-tRNA--protein transferase [Actinomycetota bacterium]|nr:leucyl/phenylalanyl-tRNA--protein transferase [Actinomycetota bacterium]